LNHEFQERLNVINPRLKLPKTRELDVELFADLGELIFNGSEDLGLTRPWSRRASLASRTTAPGPAALAPFAALAVFACSPFDPLGPVFAIAGILSAILMNRLGGSRNNSAC
jgi:hypothetical protein